MAVARAWARPGRAVATVADDSLHKDAVTAWLGQRSVGQTAQEIEICPDELGPVQLFLALSTQWRRSHVVSLTGSVTLLDGIDYGVIRETATMMEMEMTPALFLDLRIMESAARAAANRHV